jgi:sugar O-acyltransferase (sialic acid O-acetyltransferase NeuD family)
MKENIILIGGGGHCKSCIDVIDSEGRYSIAGIVDLKEYMGKKVLGYEVIASDEDLPRLTKDYLNYFITMGQIQSPMRRIRIYETLKGLNANLPVIISPVAYLSKYARVDEGTIVMHHAVINADAQVGKNCIINTKAVIEHDALIESNCHISTGAIINGGTIIRQNSFVGSNAMVKEYVEVGRNSVVGGGLSVMKDLPENSILKDRVSRE